MKVLILAGGAGTRLYPLSTEECPKQFLKLADNKSLLVNTVERFLSLCRPSDIVVITNQRYKDITQQELADNNLQEVSIVTEPAKKNTAPAIVLGVRNCIDKLDADKDEPIIIAPSDHVIRPVKSFEASVNDMQLIIKNDKIATLGVVPTRPDTGYGYIRVADREANISDAEKFYEKPDSKTAEQYIKSGDYYWNAGIYGFSYNVLISELKKHAPELAKLLARPVDTILSDYPSLTGISIDYAVSEKSKNIAVAKMQAEWSDIGGFVALYELSPKDKNGNAVIGNVKYENCKNCLLIAETEFAAYDLSDYIAIQNGCSALIKKNGDKN